MKKLLLPFLLSCLITCTLVSSVSAQLPYFTPNFDRIYYYLGDTGAVKVNIVTTDQAFDIRDMSFQLYFTRTDGTFFVTERFLVDYTDTPLQISANDNANVTIDFNIPQRSDLLSGIFYYDFNVTLREQGTITYSEESSGQRVAKLNDETCILLTSETTPSPTPTTEPTPTPTPTPTSTPTPTPTSTSSPTPTPSPTPAPTDFLSVEVLFGIGIVITAVVIIVVLIMLKKMKK